MWKSALAILALVAALVYQYALQSHDKKGPRITFRGGNDYPAIPQAAELSPPEIAAFRRDGFLLLKHVISGDELAELRQAGERLFQSRGGLTDWLMRKVYSKLATQVWRQDAVFAQAAFETPFPALAAQLMNQDAPLRILKDGFFGFQQGASKSQSNTGCSFHIDDKFFWPTADDTTGVNVWLTLSFVTAAQGGGIRVVNQSLVPPDVARECLAVIRQHGPQSYNATCQMETLSPPCYQRLLAASVVYDMEPGDALLWDRWTFHRSEPFVEEDRMHGGSSSSSSSKHKLRYTIRYVPDTAVAEGAVHPSVPQGARLSGSPYYPQVWPTYVREEVDAIREGIEADMALTPEKVLRMLWSRLGLSK